MDLQIYQVSLCNATLTYTKYYISPQRNKFPEDLIDWHLILVSPEADQRTEKMWNLGILEINLTGNLATVCCMLFQTSAGRFFRSTGQAG